MNAPYEANGARGGPMSSGRRLAVGFRWGVVATVIMSVVMIAGTATGLSPMPKPIPVALVARMLGAGLSKPVRMVLGAVAHLGYGGVFGAVLAAVARPATVWKGVGIGVALWFVMQVVWLPYLGWGAFGASVTPRIAVATLVLHLIYGASAGWLIDRSVRSPAR
jgi:Family of unknown function (DUF6789)